ncbi:MAG: prolyl-tRNA synthetase associated domain-containing protein [Clostridia bacterium]|nr:prolyl-tRNA synthetase associated domain-containing protein [Clostridia bacterium]
MIHVSEPYDSAPAEYRNDLHRQVYETLEKLSIPYYRVDTDEAITMDDCVAIADKLNTPVVKTLLLCNRQQTNFYLLVTTSDKPFSTKNFSRAMEISRVSFASPEQLESMLGTKVGSASVLSLLHDPENRVQLVIDRQALIAPWFGCSDTTTTGYMKLVTDALLQVFLPYVGHVPAFIDI